MKVILTMDVPSIGTRGDRVEVAAGYARNYLIPRRLAVSETSGAIRVLQEESKLTDVRDSKARKDAEKISQFLAENDLFATLKIGREGKAFGSVTSKDIAILLNQAGLEVDRRRIHLDKPLRRLGVFEVPLQIHHDVPTMIKISVDQDGGSKAGAQKEQDAWDAAVEARAEAAREEAEARAERQREAEEAARIAIEKAEARKAREEEEAKAKAEAEEAAKLAAGGTAKESAEDEAPGDKSEPEVSESA